MLFEIPAGFEFGLAYVAMKPFNVDVVLEGKMPFEMAATFALELAHVA